MPRARAHAGVLVLLLVSVLAAGCLGEGATVDRSPEARAQRATAAFQSGMEEGGDIQKITGILESTEMGGEIEMVFGLEDVQKLSVSVGGLFQITLYCDNGRGLTQFGGKTYESREAECFDVGGESASDSDALDPLANATLEHAEENADGSLTVRYHKTDEEGGVSVVTATIDAQDRITNLLVEDEESTMDMEVVYGARETVRVPTLTQRLPANVDAETWFEDGHYAWTVLGTSETLPVAEFEVRVLDPSAEEGHAPLATFRLDGGDQEAAGFSFRYVDDDGDGLVSAGDSFSVTSAAWTDQWEYEVVVFDTWAGLGLDENPMPFPGALAMVAALAGLAVALGRRR